MPIKLTEKNGGKLLEVRVSGKLAHEDYHYFVPEFDPTQYAESRIWLGISVNL